MRTVSAFMKKLEVIGGNTLNWRERIELRYGYVVRIMEKIRRKTGQKGKTKKNSRKELKNYEKYIFRISQVVVAVAKASCSHRLWLIAYAKKASETLSDL